MGDPHQQTLARLDWELEQRKRWDFLICGLVSCETTVLPDDWDQTAEHWNQQHSLQPNPISD
jgi:hypothetical protein